MHFYGCLETPILYFEAFLRINEKQTCPHMREDVHGELGTQTEIKKRMEEIKEE